MKLHNTLSSSCSVRQSDDQASRGVWIDALLITLFTNNKKKIGPAISHLMHIPGTDHERMLRVSRRYRCKSKEIFRIISLSFRYMQILV